MNQLNNRIQSRRRYLQQQMREESRVQINPIYTKEQRDGVVNATRRASISLAKALVEKLALATSARSADRAAWAHVCAALGDYK